MGYNPFAERGRPIAEQLRNWESLAIVPYMPEEIDPHCRSRIILMNAIETAGIRFAHEFARHCSDAELKRRLAMMRRIEQQQQKAVYWLIPAQETTLALTVAHEQAVVDLTAWLAQTEPCTALRTALDFALIEDLDHLYRYANLLDLLGEKDPAAITGGLTEILPGRPTALQHRHPFDEIVVSPPRRPVSTLTRLHALTVLAAEQRTMDFYMEVGNRQGDSVSRGLYLEIGQVEEQHVSRYESVLAPEESWLERLVLHQYTECFLYHSFLVSEDDLRVRMLWQRHLDEELEHLRLAGELMKHYEHRDPAELLGETMPEPIFIRSNKQYIRKVLAEQVDRTACEGGYIQADHLGDDSGYRTVLRRVNSKGFIPSQRVVQDHIARFGLDYRQETEGPHPVRRLRTREAAVT